MGKKQKRTIFLLLGALLVVAAAIAVLLLLPEKEEGGQDGPSVVLTDRPVDEVASLAVENEKGSYQFIQVTTGSWQVPSLGDIPLGKNKIYECSKTAAKISATQKVSDSADDNAKYGLDQIQGTATVTYTDGTSVKLEFGDEIDGGGRYFRIAGKDAIYAGSANALAYLTGQDLDLIDLELSPYDSTSSDNLKRAEFQNASGVFVIENIQSQQVTDGYGNFFKYRVSGAAQGYVDSAFFAENFTNLVQFRASSAIAVDPTPEQLAGYGLDAPQSYLLLGEGDSAIKVLIGRADGDIYYAMRDGYPVVFKLADYVVNWLEISPFDILNKYATAPSMDQVREVTLDIGGEKTVLAVTDAATRTGTCNGQATDAKLFGEMYQLLCSARPEEQTGSAQKGEQVAAITFTYNDGNQDVMALFSTESRKLLVQKNGQDLGLARRALLDALKQGAENLQAGKQVSKQW